MQHFARPTSRELVTREGERETRSSLNLLTVILLAEVSSRSEDVLDECGVDLLHGQVLDAVRVPVHVVPDAL